MIGIGFVIVNPTGTFVGGTTDVDDATVAPNYGTTPLAFLPTMQAL
jgi:hypothetical protein